MCLLFAYAIPVLFRQYSMDIIRPLVTALVDAAKTDFRDFPVRTKFAGGC